MRRTLFQESYHISQHTVLEILQRTSVSFHCSHGRGYPCSRGDLCLANANHSRIEVIGSHRQPERFGLLCTERHCARAARWHPNSHDAGLCVVRRPLQDCRDVVGCMPSRRFLPNVGCTFRRRAPVHDCMHRHYLPRIASWLNSGLPSCTRHA